MAARGIGVFLAGATGLAGSSILRRLLNETGIGRIRAGYTSGDGVFIEDTRVEYVRGDLRRPEDCDRMVADADLAILAAAQSGGAQEAVSAPWRQVTDNIVMDAVQLEALHRAGVKRAVFISSATVYPEKLGYLKENDLDWNRPPAPAHLGIGYAKRAAESLCHFWYEKAGMKLIVARASNIFGPYAKFDPARANFIPALVRKAVAKQDPFEVWGSPEVTRDVIFSEDFGDAIVTLACCCEISYGTFNVGSGHTVSVGEVVTQILSASGYSSANVQWRQDRPATVEFRALDCTKIGELGWRPRIGLEEGVRRTVSWWQENKDVWKR